MTLREQRIDFGRRLHRWKEWFYSEFQPDHPDAEIAPDEGRIISPRAVWNEAGDERESREDAVHRRGSRHHEGCAEDELLYVAGVYIRSGNHPYWLEMGKKAEELGLVWGGRFGDANHLSTKSPDGRM